MFGTHDPVVRARAANDIGASHVKWDSRAIHTNSTHSRSRQHKNYCRDVSTWEGESIADAFSNNCSFRPFSFAAGSTK